MNLKPDSDDPLKIRRTLAVFTLVWAVTLLPVILITGHKFYGVSDSLANSIMIYVGTLAAGPLGAYAVGAHYQDKKEAANAP